MELLCCWDTYACCDDVFQGEGAKTAKAPKVICFKYIKGVKVIIQKWGEKKGKTY